MTAAEIRAEIRALRLLPGGAWPRAMWLLEVLAEMVWSGWRRRGEPGGTLEDELEAAPLGHPEHDAWQPYVKPRSAVKGYVYRATCDA